MPSVFDDLPDVPLNEYPAGTPKSVFDDFPDVPLKRSYADDLASELQNARLYGSCLLYTSDAADE